MPHRLYIISIIYPPTHTVKHFALPSIGKGLVDDILERSRGSFDVLSSQDGGTYGNGNVPGRAGVKDIGHSLHRNAADRDNGHGHLGRGCSHVVQPNALLIALGRSGKDRTDSDVVRPISDSLPSLLDGVCGDAKNPPLPKHPARGRWGQVLLTQMHAVRLDETSDVGTVIDNEAHAHVCRHPPQLPGHTHEFTVTHLLLPQLDHVGSAPKDLPRSLKDRDLADGLREQNVEPH